jgi:hypothetical protein
MFLILIFLTFSRSAIIATIFIEILNIRSTRRYILWGVPFIISVLIIYLINDDSGTSKIDIYLKIIEFIVISSSVYDLIFGIGLGGFQKLFGIQVHSLYGTYFIEGGIIGGVLFIIFLFLCYLKDDRFIFLYGILPSLIAGLSYFMYLGGVFFFVDLALMISLSKHSTLSLNKIY